MKLIKENRRSFYWVLLMLLTVIACKHISEEQMITREIITELMCNKKIIWSSIAQRLKMTENRIKENVNLKEIKTNRLIF